MDQLKKKLIDELDIAFDQESTNVRMVQETNSEPVHPAVSPSQVGMEVNPQTTINISSPRLQAEITISEGKQMVTFGDDDDDDDVDPKFPLGIEENGSDYSCPLCDCTFDTDVWIDAGGWGDRSGAMFKYDCPTDDCEGKGTVHV